MGEMIFAVNEVIVSSLLKKCCLLDQPMAQLTNLCRLDDCVVASVEDFELEARSLFQRPPKRLRKFRQFRIVVRCLLADIVTHVNNTTDLVP